MYCKVIDAECPYPDIVINQSEVPVAVDETPELECATGMQLSQDTVCGVAALACLAAARERTERGVAHA